MIGEHGRTTLGFRTAKCEMKFINIILLFLLLSYIHIINVNSLIFRFHIVYV